MFHLATFNDDEHIKDPEEEAAEEEGEDDDNDNVPFSNEQVDELLPDLKPHRYDADDSDSDDEIPTSTPLPAGYTLIMS